MPTLIASAEGFAFHEYTATVKAQITSHKEGFRVSFTCTLSLLHLFPENSLVL